MAAGLTSLFKLVALFARLTDLASDTLEIRIRVDHFEATRGQSGTFKWSSYVVLRDGSGHLIKEQAVACPSGVAQCKPVNAMLYDEYQSSAALVAFEDTAQDPLILGLMSIPPKQGFNFTQTLESDALIELDMNTFVTYLNGTSALHSIDGLTYDENGRVIKRTLLPNTVYGFDRWNIGRVHVKNGNLVRDKLFDLNANDTVITKKEVINFSSKSSDGWSRTQFYSAAMMNMLVPKFSLPSGFATVQLTLMPNVMKSYRRAYRYSLSSNLYLSQMLIILVLVGALLIIAMDAAVLVIFCWFSSAKRAEKIHRRKKSSSIFVNYWVEHVPEERITMGGEEVIAITPGAGDEYRQQVSSVRKRALESFRRLFPSNRRLQKTQRTAESVRQLRSRAHTPVQSKEAPTPKLELEKTQIDQTQ